MQLSENAAKQKRYWGIISANYYPRKTKSLYICPFFELLINIKLIGGNKMDRTLRLGKLSGEETQFLDRLFDYEEVSGVRVFNLVASLAAVPYLSNVRMEVYGGPISGARLGVVAEMEDSELVARIARQNNNFDKGLVVRGAYQQLEQALGRPRLFQHFGVEKVPVGDSLDNQTDRDYYALQGSIVLNRKEGTAYKVDFLLPVELRVQSK